MLTPALLTLVATVLFSVQSDCIEFETGKIN